MDAVHHDVFSKFKPVKKLSTRQEADGREVQVEVREDEEQSVKLQEIIDLLVAAGYFRARIKGLSSFDKVVGGMTWCIESCNVDVDVDLLFQENSTIGQKIALTEKIVAVLPELKCPHRIEPHQIQGLDFIHIFPVIQWLVKRSMEYRQEMSSFVRSYAVNQFNKEFPQEPKNAVAQKQVLGNIRAVNEVYRPRRFFRRKNAPPPDINSRVRVTLLEYGMQGTARKSHTDRQTSEEGVTEEDEQTDKHVYQQLLNSMVHTNEDFDAVKLNKEDEQLLEKHYKSLLDELEDGGIKSNEEKQIIVLTEQKAILNEKYPKLLEEKDKLDAHLEEESDSLKAIAAKIEEASKTLSELEKAEVKNPETVKEVEELVIINDGLRAQELQFREHCKQELARLQEQIEELKTTKTGKIDAEKTSEELQKRLDGIKELRLQVAKKNRSTAALQRQLDDIPSRAELGQYQRRFLELYNQVATKHKETKQYYALYNTLEDTRLYLKKELSLLNSISENYPQAVLSSSSKDEFLQQLGTILDGVNQSKKRAESRLLGQRQTRDELSRTLQSFVEQQRKYVAAVRQLGIECKKHESLLAQQNV